MVRSTRREVDRVTLDMENRPLRDVAIAIQSEGDITVKLAPSLDPDLPVSVRVRDQPVTVVLDALSAQVGARWSLAGGVYALYPDVSERPNATLEQQVPPPLTIGIRLVRDRREVGTPRRINLSWSRPVVVESLPENGETELVLSWLPLGPKSARLLPLLVECADSGPRLVHRFDLIDPSEKSVNRVDLGGSELEILPEAPSSWPLVQTAPNAPVCGRADGPLLDLELSVKGERWATTRQLIELPGRFWVAAAGLEGVSPLKDSSVAALVYLGRSATADSLRELLLVSEDSATGRMRMQPLRVAAAMSRTVSLQPFGDDGPTYTIKVRAPR